MLEKFVSTILSIISNPYKYFLQDMPKGDSLKESLIFTITVSSVSFAVQSVSFLSILRSDGLLSILGYLILFCIFMPVLKLFFLCVFAFFAHMAIFFFVPQRTGFKQTFKVLAYSSAANVFLVVPVVGIAASVIFEIRAFVFGLSAVHNVSCLKMLMLFVIVLIIISMFLVILSLFLFGAAILSYIPEFLPPI
ncbi:MAG: hypothetical protein LBH98_00485 [Chitinispirillales bacterium]|nr:hypothetical protein [Chitinispirillales bacterium]